MTPEIATQATWHGGILGPMTAPHEWSAGRAGAPANLAASAPSALFPVVTLPSAVTLAGYAVSLAWIAGGPWWLGVLGLLADEVDGRLARATGDVSRFGGELDYAVDLTLTGLSAARFGPIGLASLPFVTALQAAIRARGDKPDLGSARALYTLARIVL